MVVDNFNISAQKTETGESLRSRSARSTDKVLGQLSLGNEGNHQNQKTGKYIMG